MKLSKELLEALKKALGTSDQVFPAIVKTVDRSNCTCEIEVDGLELGGIRLRATVSDGKGAKIYPALESVVLVQKLGEKEEFFVTLYSEVEEVLFEADNTVFQVKEGFKLEKGGESLKDILGDLLAEIKLITVPTNTGPSGVPMNAISFEEIENRIENFFN